AAMRLPPLRTGRASFLASRLKQSTFSYAISMYCLMAVQVNESQVASAVIFSILASNNMVFMEFFAIQKMVAANGTHPFLFFGDAALVACQRITSFLFLSL